MTPEQKFILLVPLLVAGLALIVLWNLPGGRGERNGPASRPHGSKTPDVAVEERVAGIRCRLGAGASVREVAREFQVSPQTVFAIQKQMQEQETTRLTRADFDA